MKKLLYLLTIILCSTTLFSCDDEWGNDNAEMEHIYYYGFQDWGHAKNDVVYSVKQGSTVTIPTQFWCEFVRSYDVVTYYYVSTNLKKGVDYEIVDEKGAVLNPDANGAYSFTWKNAVKGIQNIYVKALNGATGTLSVQTFDPNSDKVLSNQDISSTIQSTTDNYEVRIFTQNYKVTVKLF